MPSKKNINDIDTEIKKLHVEKDLLLDKYMNSSNAEEIIKAASYIEQNNNKTGNLKSYIFDPQNEFNNGLGYKDSLKSITYDVLNRMSRIPQVNSILTTRIEQVHNYGQFTTDLQKEGWTITKNLGRFEDAKSYKITDKDKRVIDKIATFIENGGLSQKWDLNDDFEDYLSKSTRDSLILDQDCTEFERNKRGELISYMQTDSSTMRLLQTIDPLQRDKFKFDEIRGYLPIYCQTWNSQILRDPKTKEPVVFYPWELSFNIRNKTSDIRNNGYGVSELEILIEILTWLLWGMSYNGNFFKQGSNPRGFFTVEGALNNNMLNQFRDFYRQMVTGVNNAHKTMVLEGNKVNWVDLHTNNKDMEFSEWNDFLTLLTCAVYRIDPSELGFNFNKQAQIFGQDGQKQRLEHSKEKGLKPLLKNRQKIINKYIVSELDPSYKFIFTGINLEDESEILENDIKKINSGFLSLEDGFEKYNDRKFNPEKDTILNSVYLQSKQMNMYGDPESNEAVDEMTGEQGEGISNPFSDVAEKSISDNPIMDEVAKYTKKLFTT